MLKNIKRPTLLNRYLKWFTLSLLTFIFNCLKYWKTFHKHAQKLPFHNQAFNPDPIDCKFQVYLGSQLMMLVAHSSIPSLASRFLQQENSYLSILRPSKEESSPKYISKNLYTYTQENKDSILNSISIISLTSKQ